jgi:3-deoxy-D-manno-octulosonic-acid transferase
MLHFFTWIFVQDLRSIELLKTIKIYHSSISGDTRFDRVSDIQNQEKKFSLIDQFIDNKKIIVAGSTWPDDEQLLSELMREKNDDLKLIIAPHEINDQYIKSILSNFTNAIQYSKANDNISSYSILIIDNVGMLSQLYQYASITYIGGGFNKSGIHNTLEAAVWEKPVLFGPNFQKFKEARDLVKLKAGFSVSTPGELKNKIFSLLNNESASLFSPGKQLQIIYKENKGATEINPQLYSGKSPSH